MELKKLIEECSARLQEAVEEEIDAEDYNATVETNDGYVYLTLINYGGSYDIEIEIDHNENMRRSPNLEEFLTEKVDINWEGAKDVWREATMDEWESHGFRDEADFWYWKEGR